MSMRLSNTRYEQIKGIVAALFLRYQINCIPVDSWLLAKRMNIQLTAFSELSNEQLQAAHLLCNGGIKYRVVDINNNSIQHILYDDTVNKGRQRFTILHELGHIVLNHKQESTLADAEADFFAKYAIAPPMLVHMLHPFDYLEIASAFGLSRTCAFNAMNYYNKWLNVQTKESYEYTLTSLFTSEDEMGNYRLRMQERA